MRKIISLLVLFIIISCASKRRWGYIKYYEEVYEADSLLLLEKKNKKAFLKYKRLFKKYPPKNTEFYDEYENYIKLGFYLNKNFGGKKSLHNLIKLNAGWWKYKKSDSVLNEIYKRYNFDDNRINNIISEWNSNLNHTLKDSIILMKKRDQLYRGNREQEKLDKINQNSLVEIFETYGFPNYNKIGAFTSEGQSLNIISLINHMSNSSKYDYFEKKLFEFVKNGECDPIIYALLVDRRRSLTHTESKYGVWSKNIIDTININKNRKNIGLPTIQYNFKMMKIRQKN